jgi:MoaA/NifB/PqqE/SkfB family radical SAM enzyme
MQNQITKRHWIHVGNACNVKCKFCYYIDSLTAKNNKTTEEIKKDVDFLKSKGLDRLDFTGGEPTIRKDIVEVVRYSRERGFKQVGVITNGFKMADEKFSKELIDAGLNDALFSLHGHNVEVHDKLTQLTGSFERIVKAMRIVKEQGIEQFRTNTVVNKENYKNLPEMAELLVELKPRIANFILFNPAEDARLYAQDMMVAYGEAAPYVKKAIDILKPHVGRINIRYIPLCFMEGYEEHVCNTPQQSYDPYETDNIIRERMHIGLPITVYHIAKGFIHVHPSRYLTSGGVKPLLNEAWVKGSQSNSVKSNECGKCSYGYICGGVNKEYAEFVGLHELKAVPGKKVKNPVHFRKNYFEGY